MNPNKTIQLVYYAILREQRGLSEEKHATSAATARELYEELKNAHGFNLQIEDLKVAINGDFTEYDNAIRDGDDVVFIPPVTGG